MDLHDENYKVSTKEIKGLNTWRVILWSWTRRLNTEKMSVLPTMIYRFKCNSYQNHSKFLRRHKLILVVFLGKYLQGKALECPTQSWKKKKKKRRKHFPNVKDYHIAAVIETVVLSWDKHRDQWSRIQNPQIEPHQYA